MPRGAAKTTLLLIIYTLQRIANKNLLKHFGMPYDNLIVIICQNERYAFNRIRDIKMAIEQIPELQDLKGKEVWRSEAIITSNEVKVIGKGRGTTIRGETFYSSTGMHRPSLILIDDMEKAEELRNPEIRENQLEWFNDDVMRAGEIDGTMDVIISDTLKHEESILGILKERPGWETLFYQAIETPQKLYHPTQEHLWKEWPKDIYGYDYFRGR